MELGRLAALGNESQKKAQRRITDLFLLIRHLFKCFSFTPGVLYSINIPSIFM